MQAAGKTPQALRTPRRVGRLRKTHPTKTEPPKPADPVRQQSGTEFTARLAGDWPPNTWWP
jgi:hypothetical protein